MKSKSFSMFDVVVYIFATFFALATLTPFLNVISVSLSTNAAFLRNPMMIIPTSFDLNAYKTVVSSPLFLSSAWNTVFITLGGTALSMILITCMAYPIANSNFKARPFVVYFMVVTMMFNGGLIPNFYLIQSLGLYDSLWALILPGSLSTFNVILMSNYFKSIPASLEEAAKIDGASDFYILFRIYLPLSLPIISTLALFCSVGRWNSFFNAIIYIRNRSNWPLQLLLREVIISSMNMFKDSSIDPTMQNTIPFHNIRYATIVVTILPILCVYPFLQKYFIKGIMIGSVKG